MITYHTDGSCRPTNPGPGGYAVIRDGRIWTFGCKPSSTNIVMEGEAMYSALNDAQGRECIVYSDSEFWINVLTKWAPGWEKKGWKKSSGEIKNLELVKRLYSAYQDSKAKLQWVKGHADDEGNILADRYARIGSGYYVKSQSEDWERALEDAIVECGMNYQQFEDPAFKMKSWCGTCEEIGKL